MGAHMLNQLNKSYGEMPSNYKYGYQLNETVISCSYNLASCDSLLDQYFAWKYDSLYGDCFSFNQGIESKGPVPRLKAFRAGNNNGLFLVNLNQTH